MAQKNKPHAVQQHDVSSRFGSTMMRKRKRTNEHNLIQSLTEKCAQLATIIADPSAAGKESAPLNFGDLPLSPATLEGLSNSSFVAMTEIQRAAIPFALDGRDILGAAKTGSGKTLAFIVPILERLYRAMWTPEDGLGALVLSPTRELALQIFAVLRAIGARHSFSAGLLVGNGSGRSVDEEKVRLSRMNILISTPGRLLQHMDETPGFECNNLQVLVLDEADNILDSGFAETVDAIIDFLPEERQTLLFSATQTKSVKDLARLSLNSPQYVAVHEDAEESTPTRLVQAYTVCELQDKMDLLWSFLKSHLTQKIIVFISTCKTVRYVYEILRRLQPGLQVLHLHGKQGMQSRIQVASTFARARASVLLSTDVAARGLDFPTVQWVFQYDSPDDAATYIHRVGRTARHSAAGNALLVVTPQEEQGVLQAIAAKRVGNVRRVGVKMLKTSIKSAIASFCSESPDMKYLAQRAFTTYVRCINQQKNKDMFPAAHDLPLDAFAESLGLPGTPILRFVQRGAAKSAFNLKNNRKVFDDSDDEFEYSESKEIIKLPDFLDPISVKKPKGLPPVKTKLSKMLNRKNNDVLSEHYQKMIVHDDIDQQDSEQKKYLTKKNNFTKLSASHENIENKSGIDFVSEGVASCFEHNDDDDDLFEIRREAIDQPLDELTESAPDVPLTHRRILREKHKALKTMPLNKRILFDDETEEAFPALCVVEESKLPAQNTLFEAAIDYHEQQYVEMRDRDIHDKMLQKQRRRETRLKKKNIRQQERVAQAGIQIGSHCASDAQEEKGFPDFEHELAGDEELAARLLAC